MTKERAYNFYSETEDNTPVSEIMNAKYRTEQTNTTSIENDVKSYSILKKEYDININLNTKIAWVALNDLYYDFKPPTLSKVYEFISKTDYIRNNIKFSLSEDGRLAAIYNKDELYENWSYFKENDLEKIDFIKTLKAQNKEEFENIIREGDNQFAPANADLEKDYQRDLLYIILFDKHLAHDLKSIPGENGVFQSQLFPKVKIPMEIRYDVINESESTIGIRKVAEAIIDEALIKEIEEQYNEIHQPLVHYSFSDYKLTYRVAYEVDKKTRIISAAQATIIEDVENNVQSLCKYKLKKL